MLVVDEAHKLDTSPALASLVARVTSAIKLGLTAYEPPPIVRHLIGPVNARLTLHDLRQAQGVVLPRYIPVATEHAGKAFEVDTVIRGLISDSIRNEQIRNLTIDLAGQGHRVMLLSGNPAHCAALGRQLRERLGDQVGVITGKAAAHAAARMRTLKRVESGGHSVLVGDERLCEGMDLPLFDRLVLALPTADPRWVLQQVGRIMRPAESKRDAVIYDLVDRSPGCLAQLAERRVRHLRAALDWTAHAAE